MSPSASAISVAALITSITLTFACLFDDGRKKERKIASSRDDVSVNVIVGY